MQYPNTRPVFADSRASQNVLVQDRLGTILWRGHSSDGKQGTWFNKRKNKQWLKNKINIYEYFFSILLR